MRVKYQITMEVEIEIDNLNGKELIVSKTKVERVGTKTLHEQLKQLDEELVS